MPFPMVLAQNECKLSFRIWTQVADSISYVDNRHAKRIS